MFEPHDLAFAISQRWNRMARWRANWSERESRLQARLLAAELDQIRSLETNVERLLLVAEAEELLSREPINNDEEHSQAVRRLRDEVEAESIRAVLNTMQH
jgi:sensor histidine kinase regulating citrate/malate metabolism